MKQFFRQVLATLFLIAMTHFAPYAIGKGSIQERVSFNSNSTTKHTKTVTAKIISAADDSFGYDIYVDGRLCIHQVTVPGLPGNKGFKSRRAAEKVAQLVIVKINRGEMPPTVTIEEMKKLKAI